MQMGRYGPGQHYAHWHTDADQNISRDVTVVTVLKQCERGGEFQYKKGNVRVARLNEGDAIVFDSRDLEHRVTPVTEGSRESVVLWGKYRQ